ncbi:Mu transposase C-terminal domain-containing protein [Janthinobacterium aquaticum]|uniref:Mu transposase C-terminal domain-containing protein n=1 Tax=Janthinobacterium sp. FT58W TaxID=2654254 RepID=UPI001264829F|nr:Mu transposase C-terminal domain-containing protein [Janthinobacterium sp. FT58W]KAB8043172.1 DDE-type integrase/transposase/recombinase [Janthinobacterium sp. FT58W]
MNKIPKGFLTAKPGQRVSSGGKNYQISHLVTVSTVFAVNEETKESTRLDIESLRPPIDVAADADGDSEDKDILLYSKEDWAIAQQRLHAIKPLLQIPVRTRANVEQLAQERGLHVATLYKWLKLYQSAGHVSALVPTKRGRRIGTFMLNAEQEKLIEEVINDDYLTKQRKKPQDIIDEVQRRARLAKIDSPSGNTIRKRIQLLPQAETLRRRGQKEKARNMYDPILGEFPEGEFPLQVVQFDHTPGDIILVDEVHRQPIGRPWLTVAIDVYSRMIVGLYVTFEPPSSTSIGLCVAHAICPKREYLANLGVSGEWLVWGMMNSIYVDNAKEFRGAVLERGCDEYEIDLQWRPVQKPHYGGIIERYMGVLANQIRKWPGATFSNPAQRKGYDSEAESALTLKEFEAMLVDFIVNVYHQRMHSELGMPPRKKWELGILGDATTPGVGVPPLTVDPLRLQLDFMPFFERSVQQYGIQIELINYYDPVLIPYINSTDPDNPNLRRSFIIRRDPRDISKVYFFDPVEKSYFPIPYANVGRPAMSAWELKEVKRLLTEQGRKDVDEDTIFEALGRMREAIEGALEKTKAARRQATRTPKAAPRQEKLAGGDVAVPGESSKPTRAMDDDDDPFAQPIQPFENVSLIR